MGLPGYGTGWDHLAVGQGGTPGGVTGGEHPEHSIMGSHHGSEERPERCPGVQGEMIMFP